MSVLSAIASAGCILWLGLVAYGAYSLWVTRNDAINKALDRAACMERHPSNHDPARLEQMRAIADAEAAWNEDMWNETAIRDHLAGHIAARHTEQLAQEAAAYLASQEADK